MFFYVVSDITDASAPESILNETGVCATVRMVRHGGSSSANTEFIMLCSCCTDPKNIHSYTLASVISCTAAFEWHTAA